ncbi:MAG: polysaccharide biosynthesis/export family protein [Pseudomonadota bacterium]
MFVRTSVFVKLAIAALIGPTLVACSSYAPAPQAFHEVIQQPYILDAGDVIRVTVFDQGDLTNTYAVDKSGYISFPLVGSVAARGKTSPQMEAALAQRLREGFLRDPDVSVEVATYRPVFIMGEVGASGQYTYVPGMTVQNAIAAGGGFTPRAFQRNVDVTRQINGNVLTGRVLLSDPLFPGDTIYVRERWF